jgi:hypothetical protein
MSISRYITPPSLSQLHTVLYSFYAFDGHFDSAWKSHSDQVNEYELILFFWRNIPQWARTSQFTRFLHHTQRRTIVGRAPLDGWWAHRKDLYLTTQHPQQTDTLVPGEIWTHSLNGRATGDTRLSPRGHWTRQYELNTQPKSLHNFQYLIMIHR